MRFIIMRDIIAMKMMKMNTVALIAKVRTVTLDAMMVSAALLSLTDCARSSDLNLLVDVIYV